MTASVNSGAFGDQGTAPVLSVANAGDLILMVVLQTAGYVTSIASSKGSTINNSILGSFNNSNSTWTDSGFGANIGAFWGYAAGAGNDTLTPSYSTSPASRIYVADCVGIAATSPIISNIHNEQASSTTGTDALTVSGGTGSDTVGSAPALIVGFFFSNGSGNFSVGTGFTLGYNGNADEWPDIIEYERVGSTGTYDATATTSTAGQDVRSWQIALAEAATGTAVTPPVGSLTLSGSAPTAAQGFTITPLVARRRWERSERGRLIVPSRKIILPPRSRPELRV